MRPTFSTASYTGSAALNWEEQERQSQFVSTPSPSPPQYHTSCCTVWR